MPEPKPIQLALQGGGAKIFALLAAMDALHEAVDGRKVAIRRIAGTSAGAIVGALYAAGVKPGVLRQAFSAFPLDQLRVSTGTAVWRAIRSHPIVDDRPLAKFLRRLLQTVRGSNHPVRLRDLEIHTLLIASDVSGRKRVVYDSQGEGMDQDAVSCILDFCAIPFFFRAARKDSSVLVLDGGLCENLPSDLLVSEESLLGDIVAVSFIDEVPASPRTPKELAFALLDTAISASVHRSKSAGNVFLIELNPYGIGTFDFDRAHELLVGEDTSPFDLAREHTRQRLEEFYSAKGRQRVSTNRWNDADPTTMGQLFRIYASQQLQRPFRYFSRQLVIQANSLLKKNEEESGPRDLVIQKLEFAPSREPLDCIAAQIFSDIGQRPSDVDCDVYDSNEAPVPFEAVPFRDPADDGMYGLLIYFTPPLPVDSGKWYVLRTEFRVGKAFSELEDKGEDYMASKMMRVDGTVGRVELVAHIPKSFGEIVAASKVAPWFLAQPMTRLELVSLERSSKFNIHGWYAKEVPQGGLVRVDLRKA